MQVDDMNEHDTADAKFGAPRLAATFYVDEAYSQKHAHMVHKHSGTLELLYIFSGEGRYLVGHREYAVHTGNLIVCNGGTLHGESPFQQHTMQTYCIALSGVQIEGLPANCLIDAEQRPVLSLGDVDDTVRHLMMTLHRLFSDKACDTILCQTLAMSVLLLVYHENAVQQKSSRTIAERKTEYLVRHITEYLDQNYTQPVTLAEIGETLHISVSHLSHLFKRETGLAPMQYVIYRRIGEAQSLLMETEQPIHCIEEQLGFGSSCHLSAMFKKYVGISPKEYRQHFRKTE